MISIETQNRITKLQELHTKAKSLLNDAHKALYEPGLNSKEADEKFISIMQERECVLVEIQEIEYLLKDSDLPF